MKNLVTVYGSKRRPTSIPNIKAERTKKNNRPFRANPTAGPSPFKTRRPVHRSPPNKSHWSPAKSPPDRAPHLVDDERKTLTNPLDAGSSCLHRVAPVGSKRFKRFRSARASPAWRRCEGPDLGARLPRRRWCRFCSWVASSRAARAPRSAARKTCRLRSGPSGLARRCCSKPGGFCFWLCLLVVWVAMLDSGMPI